MDIKEKAIMGIILLLMVIITYVARFIFFLSIFVLIIYMIRYYAGRKKENCSDCPYRKYYNDVYNKPCEDNNEPFD